MAMEHRPLYACLKLLYTQAGLVPMRSALSRLIRQLYTHPRTLKQMSRVTIYNAVGRCPALTVNKLPLPGPLKDYILNFEPWITGHLFRFALLTVSFPNHQSSAWFTRTDGYSDFDIMRSIIMVCIHVYIYRAYERLYFSNDCRQDWQKITCYFLKGGGELWIYLLIEYLLYLVSIRWAFFVTEIYISLPGMGIWRASMYRTLLP